MAALGATAIAIGVMLIPHGREMALLHMETGDAKRALPILEQMVAAGDHSPATIAALARARAATGDIEGAARVLESLVAERPRDPAALDALAEFQRDAHRTDALLLTLEKLHELAPTAPHERELAKLYGEAGRKQEQLQTLRNLVSRFKVEPGDYLALAQAEAESGNANAGIEALRQLAARYPSAVDASMVGLEMRLLTAAGDPEQALARGRSWLQGQNDVRQAAPILAGSLSVAGRPDLAIALLQPYAGADAPPEIVTALAQAESDAGNIAQGLRRLEQLDPGGLTPADQQAALLRLRLALALGDTDRALAAADRIGLKTAPHDLLAKLAEVAVISGRTDALRHVLDSSGEAIFEGEPVIGARSFLALGDMDAARRWTDRALPTVGGRPDRAIQLAEVELRLARTEQALELLRQAASGSVPPASLRDIADIAIRAKQAAEGAALLDGVRQRQPSAEADRAWALAATAAGNAKDVEAWLARRPRDELPAGVLQDLAHLAKDAGAKALAVEAADRLRALRGSPDDSLLLAQYLLDAGQPKRALEILRSLPASTPVPEDLRTAVLLGAWRQGAPVADELRAIWVRQLAEAASPEKRNAAISILLELRAYSELLPALRRLAEQDPERWLWAYGQAATALGRGAELASFWSELGNRTSLPAGLRRQLAFRLLEAGDKAAAERIFRALASNAAPDSPDVREALFIWGARPNADQLDWIEERARRASGTEKAAWMRILTDRGAPGRSIAVYRAAGGETGSEPVLDAYVSALALTGDKAALAAAVRESLADAHSASRLHQLADFAARAGDADLERRILERLIAAGGEGPDTRRRLGILAYQRHDLGEAEKDLSAYVSETGGDYESQMILGDIATKRRDLAAARRHYAESLDLLQAAGDSSFRARTVAATLYHRL
ncbi:MAG: tetratricopeptide repeat protein, partial [Acetobacteraceae bacterium]|nr:tetratricopeptide repeat protein [Acetobacteraceae bacterium]